VEFFVTDDKLAKIEKIKKRIRALLMKTVENGATEGEAIAASEKAAELMAQWDIASADLDDTPSHAYRAGKVEFDPALEDAIWRVAYAVGELCHCKVWISSSKKSINVFGDELDCEVAEYLMAICDRSIRQEIQRADREYALYRQNIRIRKRLGFIDGLSKRLAIRILELAWHRQRAVGHALMPAKMSRINDMLKARGKEFSSRKGHQTIVDLEAWLEGFATAETVSLNRGVSRPDDAKAVGRAPLAIADSRV
jgi:hypothetical protein